MTRRNGRSPLPPWVRTEWDRLTCLTALFVATGKVAGEFAQSLLWVGPPGSGKSTLLERFAHVASTKRISDLTVDPLLKVILPEVQQRGIRHLIFPEFHKCFQRKQETVENMVGVLSEAMSGEVGDLYIGQNHYKFPGVQVGVIGAMTDEVFHTWHASLQAKGVQDRLRVMEFTLPEDERKTIVQAILSGRPSASKAPVWWDWPLHPVWITYEPDAAFLDALTQWVDEVRPKRQERLSAQVRVLLKASALMHGRTVVTVADLDVLYAVQPYFKATR